MLKRATKGLRCTAIESNEIVLIVFVDLVGLFCFVLKSAHTKHYEENFMYFCLPFYLFS